MNKFKDKFSNLTDNQHSTAQSSSCISTFLLLQLKIITLVVNKLVCSCKQFDLRSLLKNYFDGGEFVQQSEEQC